MGVVFAFLLALCAAATVQYRLNCTDQESCMGGIVDYQRQEMLNAIKSHLSGLRTRAPVNVTAETRAMYEEKREKWIAKDLEAENTETYFISARDPSDGSDPSELIATFDISDNLATNELKEAILQFKLEVPQHLHGNSHRVNVRIFEKTEEQGIGEAIFAKSFHIRGSQKIEVTLPVEAVNSWNSENPISGLFVSAILDGQNVAIHPQQTDVNSPDNMLLQLTVHKAGRSRRHSAPVCNKENPSEGCCLRELALDFTTVGWEWIISPKRVHAYVCQGDCSLNGHHFGLDDNHHRKILKEAGIGLCCHASEYDSLKIFYVNQEKKIVNAEIPGMAARRCTCS